MICMHALNVVDRLLREIMDVNLPFGGKLFLLGGDFRQITPVINHGSRTEIIENTIKMSHLWVFFEKMRLKINMRADENDKKFSNFLIDLGEGRLNFLSNEYGEDIFEIPSECICTGSLINDVFGEGFIYGRDESTQQRCIFTPTNVDSLQINEEVLKNHVRGEKHSYYSYDSLFGSDIHEQMNYPIEFLNKITPKGLPPHKLNLKIGALIILLRNLDMKKNTVNGTRLFVQHLNKHVIHAVIVSGKGKNNSVFIPRIICTSNDPDIPFHLHRRQFPIRLAYSITINKAQGQTFKKVGLYLRRPVFSHGHMYVFFSRVSNLSNAKIKLDINEWKGCVNGKYYTRNIVYKELLEK